MKPTTLNIKVSPQPKQLEAWKKLHDTPVVFFGGARGGGKSRFARDWLLIRRLKYPGTKGLLLRKTYKEIVENHVEYYLKEVPDLRFFYNKTDKKMSLPNGSTIEFSYIEHKNDVYRYQGLEYDDIVLDEATQHAEEVPKMLKASNRTTSLTGIKPRMLLTGNPGGIGHGWAKRIFIDREFLDDEDPNDFGFIQSKVWDNPTLLQRDPNYVKFLQNLPGDKRRAWLDGDWDVFEGQFFDEWRQEKHIIKPRYLLKDVPETFEFRLCWDEGTLNPRAIYLLVQDNDGRCEIVWEYYVTGEVTSESAMKIKDSLHELGVLNIIRKKGLFIYDPSMDIKSNQTGQATSDVVYNILQVKKQPANNSRVEGARKFREFLHWDKYTDPLLKVWDNCRNLIRTIPQLIYSQRNSEDIDTDGEDHSYDAVRYGLMSLTKNPTRFSLNKENFSANSQKILKKFKKYKPLGGYN